MREPPPELLLPVSCLADSLTITGHSSWRRHSCLPRRHSCRRSAGDVNSHLRHYTRHSRRFFGDVRKRGWRRGPELNRRIKVLQTSALPLGYRATLVQFSILDSRIEARSISRKPRTGASGLRRAQLSRSTFCLRCAATPPFTANPSRAGDTEAHSSSNTTTKPSAEGDTKASAEDAAGVSPRSRRAANPHLCPRSSQLPPSTLCLLCAV
jgi:hypothetical protein